MDDETPVEPQSPRRFVTFLPAEEAEEFLTKAKADGLSAAAAIRRLILISLRETAQ